MYDTCCFVFCLVGAHTHDLLGWVFPILFVVFVCFSYMGLVLGFVCFVVFVVLLVLSLCVLLVGVIL